MINRAITDLAQRIANGLNRKSIQSCSRWATEYRIMGPPVPGQYTFKYHPWCKAMHDTDTETNVGMKAAQMGLTEVGLNTAFYANDILKQDVLYVLPNLKPDAADFSTGRFDAALSLSPHLRSVYSDVMNVGHKRAGGSNFYIRGSSSRSGLKSVPIAKIIMDEVEEMCFENIPLIFERTSGQLAEDRLIWLISTPRIFNKGIHHYFLQSTQDHFIFKCPKCNRHTELIYPDCVVIIGENEHDPRIKESHYICKECKGVLDHETKHEWLGNGQWQPSFTNKLYRGWNIPQLYSSMISADKIAEKHFLALKNPPDEQELWNSKLGLPHEVKDARITSEQIHTCQSLASYVCYDRSPPDYCITLGVDVGKVCHYVVKGFKVKASHDINATSTARIISYGTVDHFEQLDDIMRKYLVRYCVIDANPERRKADEFAKRFRGRISQCFYAVNVHGKTINLNPDALTISVDRTSWLDTSLGRYKNTTIQLPMNLSEEFKDHLKALVRFYDQDRNNNSVAKYDNTSADHFAHADCYAEMALPISFNHGVNVTVKDSPI